MHWKLLITNAQEELSLNEAIRSVVCEELSRGDVRSIVDSEFRQLLNNKDFKRKVKEITTDVLEELYRTLYQRKSMWKSSVTTNA